MTTSENETREIAARGKLVLNRRIGERVRLRTESGEEIWLTVVSCGRLSKGVRLLIDAPRSVEILREEMLRTEGKVA